MRVRIGGADAGTLDLERTPGWVEAVLPIDASLVRSEIRIELTNEGPGDFVDFHEWVTQ